MEKLIEWVKTAEIGTPTIVCLNEDLRCPSLYAGKQDGVYQFIDADTRYGLTEKYVIAHNIMCDIINTDEELMEIAEIIEKVKEAK